MSAIPQMDIVETILNTIIFKYKCIYRSAQERHVGRYKEIDRDNVLDAAETIVRNSGIVSLTFDAVAKLAGISKGGIQSSFGTKQPLIAAMYQRWSHDFDQQVEQQIGTHADATERLRAHINVTCHTNKNESDRAAGVMAALSNAPEHRSNLQEWYQTCLNRLDTTTEAGRRQRLAFLANEGVFMLRSFGLLTLDETQWADIFSDIAGLLDSVPRHDAI
jgi:AcrR family transcriptional regulator